MAEKLFLGDDTDGGFANASSAFFESEVTVAAYSGKITRFYVSSRAPGNVKLSVYDVSAQPNNLLWSDDIGAPVSVGWNSVSLATPVSVLSGTSYGIGFMCSAHGAVAVKNAVTPRWFLGGQNYATFSAPDPFTYSGSDSIYNGAIAAFGWEVPTITGCDANPLVHGSSATITGTDFMTDANPITVEVCNNPVYASATIKANQNVTAQADGSVTFNVNTASLPASAWIFVTTDTGLVNAAGFAVNVQDVSPVIYVYRDGVIGNGLLGDGTFSDGALDLTMIGD